MPICHHVSYSASIWVWENSAAQGVDRTVLLAIAFHCKKNGWSSYPSLDRLAHYCQVSKSTVQRALKRLENGGHLRITSHGGPGEGKPWLRSNLYTILDFSTGKSPDDHFDLSTDWSDDGGQSGQKSIQRLVSR